MVLEDVDNTASEGFTDNPYPSSNDPYASPPAPSASGARFDARNLPHPLPVIGTFMGFSERAVRFKTETTLKFAERKVGRQLNAEEAQALAFHIYKLEQTKSYFAATGAAAGTYQWYRTWDKMKYPFYQPKVEDIDRNKFGPVRGPMAQFARHAWRFSLYVVVAGQMGSIIGQLIAQPLAAVNTSNDPKLEQFGVELKASSHADGQRNAQQGREIEDRRREFQEQVRNRSGGGPSPQARWGKQPQAQNDDAADDMSPTAGNEAWGSAPPPAESWETYSNESTQPPSQRRQAPPPTGAWNRQPPSKLQPQQSSSPFDDDDASPTGGIFQDEVNNPQSQSQTQSQDQGRPGESSWDRLRRGGPPVPLQRPQPPQSRRAEPQRREQKEGSTLGDSYTFVEGDEERSRERDSAQQEFDARLERERQGRDFDSDDGKRCLSRGLGNFNNDGGDVDFEGGGSLVMDPASMDIHGTGSTDPSNHDMSASRRQYYPVLRGHRMVLSDTKKSVCNAQPPLCAACLVEGRFERKCSLGVKCHITGHTTAKCIFGPKFPKVMELPSEIRERIYSYALDIGRSIKPHMCDSSHGTDIKFHDDNQPEHNGMNAFLGLLWVSKKTRAEALPIFYSTNTFFVGCDTTTYLDHLKHLNRFRMIRRVCFAIPLYCELRAPEVDGYEKVSHENQTANSLRQHPQYKHGGIPDINLLAILKKLSSPIAASRAAAAHVASGSIIPPPTLEIILPVPSAQNFAACDRLRWFQTVLYGIGIAVRFADGKSFACTPDNLSVSVIWQQSYQKKDFDASPEYCCPLDAEGQTAAYRRALELNAELESEPRSCAWTFIREGCKHQDVVWFGVETEGGGITG
ncbi:hypothetical protein DDE83_007877 [Stemphylium lycopersici]|uniref:Uncharacterized protein n=1 Tax=Stemphylium lycopersici TaxID=183478 RepID=A0A364MUY5_STELY|nr:hypothetical protein DDE83_007877 [Stemphylium lycopersici]